MRSSFLTKQIDFLETWFDALMLAFKLPVIILPIWLLVWYAFLPPFQSLSYPDFFGHGHLVWSSAEDVTTVASKLAAIFFLAAAVLIVGGFIQMLIYSRHSGGWSLGFGLFALILGLVLVMCISSPSNDHTLVELTLLPEFLKERLF